MLPLLFRPFDIFLKKFFKINVQLSIILYFSSSSTIRLLFRDNNTAIEIRDISGHASLVIFNVF